MPGYGMGPGMMPWGMGPGRMMGLGPGMGYGMMSHHPMMHHGMMGHGFGPGMGMMGPGMMHPGYGFGGRWADRAGLDLSTEDVEARMERWLAMLGNDRLKLGAIEEVDEDTITVEIVTVDDSLVQTLAVDRRSGWTRPAE